MDRFDIYNKLIKQYGVQQVIVAIEELSELQKELCKALRGKGNKENITEEIADVLIMIEQMGEYFDIKKTEVEKIAKQKIERTKERLLNNKGGTTNESNVYELF